MRQLNQLEVGMSTGFIPKHGGYPNLLSYKKAFIAFYPNNAICAFSARFSPVHCGNALISGASLCNKL